MQKIQSYLYPNRVILLADLAGFTTENTIVYARTVKMYKGVDNVIEFDIQNADQKRIELVTSPTITNLHLNIMDMAGNAVGSYAMTTTNTKGIATVAIPASAMADLDAQFLQYSVTCNKAGALVPLYTDSRFGAVGSIELVGSLVPVTRQPRVYTEFSGEINFAGNVINHSSAIPAKFYEAVPTDSLSFSVETTNFIGTIYLEGTTDMTVSVESFKDAVKLQTFTTTVGTTTTHNFSVPVGTYNYFRVSWMYPDVWAFGSEQSARPYGTVDKITVTS